MPRTPKTRLKFEPLEERSVPATWSDPAFAFRNPETDTFARGTPPEPEGENIPTTPPQDSGPALTSTVGLQPSIAYDDALQGRLDSCVIVSSTSAIVSATPLTILIEIPEGGRSASNGNVVNYRVRLYKPNAQGVNEPTWITVPFDGTVSADDMRPADNGEFWTVLVQRAYLQLSQDLGFNYRQINNAFRSLLGVLPTQYDPAPDSRADAQQILNALNAGKPVTAATVGTVDDPLTILNAQYGIVGAHAYTVLGIELPPSGTDGIWVTLRNPWGRDNHWKAYDIDASGNLDLGEWFEYKAGIDGRNDGEIRVPWSVFAPHFKTVAIGPVLASGSINNPQKPEGQVQFSNPNPGPFTVREGEVLNVSLSATDPEGSNPFYQIDEGPGYVQVQSGAYTWTPGPDDLGLRSVTVSASTNGFDSNSVTFLVNVTSGRPRVQSLTASTNTVTDAGTDPLVLTANGVIHDFDDVDFVEFYRDSNNNGTLDPATDFLLRKDGNISDGWSWNGQLTGVTPGNYKVFARAARYSFSDLFYSNVVSTTITVTAAPPPVVAAIPVGPETVAVSNAAGVYPVAVTKDAAGNTAVFVNLPDGAYIRKFDSAGQEIAGSTRKILERDIHHAAMQPDGKYTVVWQEGGHVYARRHFPDGSTASGAIQVTLTTDNFYDGARDSPRVAIAPDGGFLVTWYSGGFTTEDMFFRRYASNNSPLMDPYRFSSGDSGEQSPSIALDASGNAVVAWYSRNGDRVMALTLNPTGGVTGYFPVSPSGEFVNYDGVQVAFTRDGEFVVVWAAENVVFRRFAADRTPLDANPVRLSPVNGGTVPNLVTTPSGHFAVVWTHMARDPGDGEFDLGVYGQVVGPVGNLMGDNFRVPTTTTFSQFSGGLAADGGLDFTAAWGQVADRFFDPATEVRFQRFRVDLPPTTVALPVQPVGRQAKRTIAVPAVDPDGSPLIVTAINGTTITAGGSTTLSSGAKVTLNANGTFTYEPLNAVALQTIDSFAYTVTDGTKTSVGSISFRIVENLQAKSSESLTGLPAVQFTEIPANRVTALQLNVKSVGTDGILGTADDATVGVTPTWDDTKLILPGLSSGLYRVTIDDALADETGRLLDGDGNGTPGGDYVRDFVVSTSGATLDPSFGSSGLTTTNIGQSESQARTMLIQPDGKVLLGGYSNNSPTYGDFAIARYLPDGTPDSTFGTNGAVQTAFSGTTTMDRVFALALQPDGKIIAVGEAAISQFTNSNDHAFAVARYLPNGTLDTTFGGDGMQSIDLGPSVDTAYGVRVLPDGKIVISGRRGTGGGYDADMAIVRLLPDGSLDTTFDTDGQLITTIRVGHNESDRNTGFQRLTDGLLLVADVDYNQVTLARFLPNGGPDTTFGTDGVVRTPIPPQLEVVGMSLQSDGSLLVTGAVNTPDGRQKSAIARYLPNGLLDLSFGKDGVGQSTLAELNARLESAVVLADGSIVAGRSRFESFFYRFNADGSFDVSFGTDGVLTLPIEDHYATSVGQDGRLYVAGQDRISSQSEFAIARATVGPTVPLTGANGLPLLVDVNGFAAGTVSSPDLGLLTALRVNTTDFNAGLAALGASDNGRTLLTGSQSIGQLSVHREVTVPDGAGVSFARTLDVFSNTSGLSSTTPVRYVSNLGSDAATSVFATSDGDTIPETTDWWIGTDDANGSGSPAVIHVLGGPRGLKPTSVQLTGDSLVWSYNLTVEDGETTRLASFVIPATTRSQALAALNSMIARTGFVGSGGAFLTQPEIDSLENFVFLQAPTAANDLDDITGTEDVAISAIPLRPAFADVEDGAAGLTYSVVAVDGVYDLVQGTVDPTTDILTLVPGLNAHGTATITVRGTDSDGLFLDRTFEVTLDPIADAPLTDITRLLMLPTVAKNSISPPGVSVATLLRNSSNPDGSSANYGIAVTGTGGAAGQWQYSASVGGLWVPISGVSDTNALLLPRTAQVRFVPNHNITGHAGIQFRAWDGTTMVTNISSAPMAFSASEVGWAPVGINVPVFDTNGQAKTANIAEDRIGTAFYAKSLLGLLSGEFPAGSNLGLAVTDTTGNGTWQVLVGRTWQPIVGVSETSARLLKPADRVRFVPGVDWNGEATLEYRAWKVPTTLPAPTIGNVINDPTSYSVEKLSAVATVLPVNDAPTLVTSAARIFTTEPQDVVALLDGASDIDGDVAGIAITRVATRNGVWEYRKSTSDAWIAMPRPTATSALILGPTAQIRFVATANATVGGGSFDYKVFDNSIAFVNGSRLSTGSTAFSKTFETATTAFGNTSPTFKAGATPAFTTAVRARGGQTTSALLTRMNDTIGFLRGLAVTAVTGNGTWEYSIDNGRTWKSIAPLGDQRLLLRNTDRVRFTPAVGFTGTASLTFAAWDRTLGVAGDRVQGADDSQSTELLTASLTVS